MKTYTVMLIVHANTPERRVRAKSFTEAAAKVESELLPITVCHQCANVIEADCAYEAIVTDENGKEKRIKL